jgi:hypothetical protein
MAGSSFSKQTAKPACWVSGIKTVPFFPQWVACFPPRQTRCRHDFVASKRGWAIFPPRTEDMSVDRSRLDVPCWRFRGCKRRCRVMPTTMNVHASPPPPKHSFGPPGTPHPAMASPCSRASSYDAKSAPPAPPRHRHVGKERPLHISRRFSQTGLVFPILQPDGSE